MVVALGTPATLRAQTDYYNLDRGRPLRTEDALVIERPEMEWQVAPLRLTRVQGGRSVLGIEPELAWGALPRTQFAPGVPMERLAHGDAQVVGLAGVHASVLYALNAETLTCPRLRWE